MKKSNIVMLLLAALGIGSLIGASLVGDDEAGESHTSVSDVANTSTGGAPVFRYIAPDDVEAKYDEFGMPIPSAIGENFIAHGGAWKAQTVTVELPRDGAIEYKAVMSQGDAISFHWQTDGGNVYADFHAHDEETFGPDFFTRYAESEGDTQSGTIIAAYDGEHGWFWLNISEGPIVITLEVAGFFEDIIEVQVDGY